MSAAVLNTYFRERLNIGEKDEGSALPVGGIKAVFEHDITEDGA